MLKDTIATPLKGLLLSMAFIDHSATSVAVRQGLYALTALHLHRNDQAASHKWKSLQALRVSNHQQQYDPKDRLQQLAASLLLTMFEVKHIE